MIFLPDYNYNDILHIRFRSSSRITNYIMTFFLQFWNNKLWVINYHLHMYESIIFSSPITLCHIVIVARSCENFSFLELFLDLLSNCYLNPTVRHLSYSWNRWYMKSSYMKVGKKNEKEEKKNDGKIGPKWVAKWSFTKTQKIMHLFTIPCLIILP